MERNMRDLRKSFFRAAVILSAALILQAAWILSGAPAEAVRAETGDAETGSAVIRFSAAAPQVKKGEEFTVVCQVTSPTPFLDAEFTVGYDSSIIEFVRGGRKVTGTGGVLKIASTGNETAVTKKTFSLQFVAAKKGTSLIAVQGVSRIIGEDGMGFSVSSNQLAVTVGKKKGGQTPQETKAPVVTPEPVLSSNNRLKSLKTTAFEMTPEFSGDVTEYTASVDCRADILYVTFAAEDEKARVELSGNENLKAGQNEVQVLVTAENGDRRRYNILVTRETEEETRQRENEENVGSKDISFSISRKNGRIILKNAYEFEVQDVSGLTNIPAGYVQSNIELGGITVPAFTMENDLDNNYLLLYLKGPAGKSGIYQYDRQEQTMQRYTGSMTERVNKSAGEDTGAGVLSLTPNHVLLAIIVGLVILLLCMLIAMLKMAMRKKEEKNRKDYLDF